ncbi:MAG TPA: hypothetical protein VM163_06550 [bacterium]|nr:hypothetical protein [bacterium]
MQKDLTQPRYMSVSIAANYMCLSERALRCKIAMKDVPVSRIGHTIRLDRLKIDKLLEQNAVPAVKRDRR